MFSLDIFLVLELAIVNLQGGYMKKRTITALIILFSFLFSTLSQGYNVKNVKAADKVIYSNGLNNVKETIHAGTEDDPIKIIGQDGKEHVIDGSGTAVAVIDDAIGLDHPGFENKPKNPKVGQNKLIPLRDYTRDYSTDLTLPWDLWHGLHVAGIIAGNGRSGEEVGAPQYRGIAPEAQIIFAKTKDRYRQIINDTEMGQAIDDCIANGADVINMSLGTESATDNGGEVLRAAINRATAQGVVVVATTGNSGYMGYPATKPKAVNPDYGVVASPGLYSNVLCTMCFDVDNVCNRYILADDNPRKLRIKDRQFNNKNYTGIQDKLKGYIYIQPKNKNYFTAEDFPEEIVKDKFVVLDKYGPEYAITKYGDVYPGYTGAAIIMKEKGALGVILVEPEGMNYHPLEEIKVWDTNKRDYVEAGRELYEEVQDFPILGLTYEDGHALIENKKGEMTLFSEFTNIPMDTGNKITDFSSWGTSSDLVFKPDIGGSSGIGVWSFSNYRDLDGNRHYGLIQKRGTSMSAPQVSAAAAMVKQRLKLQYPELIDGNVVSLINKLLVSTAKPMQDANGTYFSPRGQGNGLLQIKEACLSDVVTKCPEDRSDIETGYSKTNLRTIGNKVEFDIELENYGLKEHTFSAPEITVLTDNIENGHITLTSKVIDNDRIKLTYDKSDIVVPKREGNEPGRKTVKVSFDLSDVDAELIKDAPNGYWIDGIVKFKGDIDIYHSFTGFKGDWKNLDVYEKFVYDFKNGEKPLYNAQGNGLYVTGFLTQMGYDKKDTAIKKVLGELPNSEADDIKAVRNRLAISPNEDSYADYIEPRFIMLRNFESIKFNIKDSEGNDVFDREYGTGNTDNGKNYSIEEKPFTENSASLRWDGKINGDTKEGLYKASIRVYKDVVDHVNPITDKNSDGKIYQEDLFDLKIDITPPGLEPIKITSKENGNVAFEINAKDKKLKGTDVDGSGIYKAVLITSKGEEELEFDPEKDTEIKQYKKVLSEKDFEDAKIKLTDWARNTATYDLNSLIEGDEVGNVNIKSVVKGENKEIDVKYMLESVSSGKVYSFYENLPVDDYVVTPCNIPEGYVLVDTDQDQEVRIEKGKTSEKTFEYEKSEKIGKIVFSEAVEHKSSEIARENNVSVHLINIKNGISYIAKLEGTKYNFSVPFGIYKIKFTNLKDGLTAKAFDQENSETKYIKSEGVSGIYYTYGFNEQSPGEQIEAGPEISEHYYEGKTYMLVKAKNNKNIEIYAYPTSVDENGYLNTDKNNPIVINEQNATITEVPSLENPNKKTYHFELKDEVIRKLVPGMVLEAKAIDKDDKNVTKSSKIAVVSYNEVLDTQKLEYMRIKADEAFQNKKISEDVKNEINEKIDDLAYDLDFDYDPIKPARAINWTYLNTYAVEGLINSYNKMNEFNKYMKEKLGEEIKYPIIYIHGGYLPNVKNVLFRVYGDENAYNGVDDFTTTVVANERAILNAAKVLKKEAIADPATEEDVTFENLNKLEMLPITKSFKIFKSWLSENIDLENDKSESDARVLFDSVKAEVADVMLDADTNNYEREKAELSKLEELIKKAEEMYNANKDKKTKSESDMMFARIDKAKKFVDDPIMSLDIIKKEYEKLEKALNRFEKAPIIDDNNNDNNNGNDDNNNDNNGGNDNTNKPGKDNGGDKDKDIGGKEHVETPTDNNGQETNNNKKIIPKTGVEFEIGLIILGVASLSVLFLSRRKIKK